MTFNLIKRSVDDYGKHSMRIAGVPLPHLGEEGASSEHFLKLMEGFAKQEHYPDSSRYRYADIMK